MAITTFDDYLDAKKQTIFRLCGARGVSAQVWVTNFGANGSDPSGAVLAGTSTTAGVVPTDADAGFSVIEAFDSGATGYLSKVEVMGTVACRYAVFDLLFKAGAYAHNTNTGLTSQPSFAGRLPGTDYTGLEIWVETVTTTGGSLAVEVTYTNEGGTGSRSTGAVVGPSGTALGRCWQLPLQGGDKGVQTIDNVEGTGGSSGTFNVLIMRRLWSGRLSVTNKHLFSDLAATGLPRVYEDSALYVLGQPDSTGTGSYEILFEIANG